MADTCSVLGRCTLLALMMEPLLCLRASFIDELSRPPLHVKGRWAEGGTEKKLNAALLNLHVHTAPLVIWVKYRF